MFDIKHSTSQLPSQILTLPRISIIPHQLVGIPDCRFPSGDLFTHSALVEYPKSRDPRGVFVVVRDVNVDSSLKFAPYTAIMSGLYLLCPAYHHFGKSDAYPAFYIMRTDGTIKLLNYNAQQLSISTSRKGLPIVGGGTTDYINWHRSGTNTDASQGCFTTPAHEFDSFRRGFTDQGKMLLLYVREIDEAEGSLVDAFLRKEF